MKMTMTPEESFNQRIWSILKEIKRKSYVTHPKEKISYFLDYDVIGDKIVDEVNFLGTLHSWKVIKIQLPKDFDKKMEKLDLKIEILNPLFDILYQLYENGYAKQIDQKKLFEMVHKLVEHPENISLEIKKTISDKTINPVATKKPDSATIVEIDYNQETGIGHANGKMFKFKDHQPEYRVFAKLYRHINKKVLRLDVLESAHFYEEGEDPDPTRKGVETETINSIAKEIRKRVGLTSEQLVMNNGNLTLVARKSTESVPE